MKKCLVIGGSGNIGRHLIPKLLQRSIQVYNFDQSALSLPHELLQNEVADLLDRDAITRSVRAAAPDFVIHLAAFISNPLSFKHPHTCLDLNIRGLLNTLSALKDSAPTVQKCLIPSTYYLNATSPEGFDSPYILSKHMQEELAFYFKKFFNVQTTVIRLSNVYGSNTSRDTLLGAVISKMLARERVIETGYLGLLRDYIYIEDVVNGLVSILVSDSEAPHLLQLGSGQAISLRELVSTVKELCNFEGEVVEQQKSLKGNLEPELVASIDEMKQIFDWQPRHSLRQGLEETIKGWA